MAPTSLKNEVARLRDLNDAYSQRIDMLEEALASTEDLLEEAATARDLQADAVEAMSDLLAAERRCWATALALADEAEKINASIIERVD